MGLNSLKICITYGFGFVAGCYFISKGYVNPMTGKVYNSGDILSVFMMILLSTSSLGQLGTVLKTLAEGK